MVRCALALLALVGWSAVAAAPLAASSEPLDPTYAALRSARPDGRSMRVDGATLERAAFRFTFEQGMLHFLTTVDGRTVGAVFLGSGHYRLEPATEGERRHLALLSGDSQLESWSDSFDRLLLLFTDDTFEALSIDHPVVTASPDPRARAAFDDLFAWQRDPDHFATNFHLRLLFDLLNRPQHNDGVFLALIDGQELSPALAAVDPLGADAIGLATDLGGEDVALYSGDKARSGFWYLSHRAWELERHRTSPYLQPADATHYRIETRVVDNTELDGETTITMKVVTPSLRVLPIQLMRKLRISAVDWAPGAGDSGADWRPAAWIQEQEKEDANAAVVLPVALDAGSQISLRLHYSGKEVLADVGDGNYVVGARDSWYPNLGSFTDLANFDLVFHTPPHTEVVATGTKRSATQADGETTSAWSSGVPMRVAGFNYGHFKRFERDDAESKLKLEVFTNPGTPDILRQIDAAIRSAAGQRFSATGGASLDNPSPTDFNVGQMPTFSGYNTAALADSALVDGVNSARVFTTYFGQTQFDHVAVTQQSQWNFGQSWPTLVFLPYLSFIHGGIRQQLGLQGIRDEDLEGLAFHELSHQWWGHEVGWASYHDQWLSEGFAQFSAGLVLEFAHGHDAADHFYEQLRRFLFERPAGNALVNSNAGPISLGWRLASWKSPSAYQAVVYGKGAFLLHMLRMMMRDGAAPNPDYRFITMMHDFVATWSGKNPSTADFQAIVEKHMAPSMNATGDGKMTWFFDQWYERTAIPKLESELAANRDGDAYRIHGWISQSGVDSYFRTLVPVYVELPGKKRKESIAARVAAFPMIGTARRQVDFRVKLPAKPLKVEINSHFDVLARD